MSTFANSEDPDEIQHNAKLLFVKVKNILRQKYLQTKNEIYFFLIIS